MKNSYKNPFSGVNASQMEDAAILDYWCSPFNHDLFHGLKEADIFQDEMNIVFMGGRSSGKSMFLRYWSYLVQSIKAKEQRCPLLQLVQESLGIGFYFRIDGPALKSFKGFNLPEEQWGTVFTHYYELLVGREYIQFLLLLEKEESIAQADIGKLLAALGEELDFKNCSSLSELDREISQLIKLVDTFRGAVALYGKPFDPGSSAVFVSGRISYGMGGLIQKHIPELKDINIVLLLDEYENFLDYQQVILNTLLKFSKPHIKYRIGIRPEGFRTVRMIGDEDFIKETREYRQVDFEELLQKDDRSRKHKAYQNFLIAIARKRLEFIPELRDKGFTDISEILTSHEDLEKDAISLAKEAPNKIYAHFAKKLSKSDLDKVRNVDNPLMELMNFVWLTRGVSADETLESMSDYLAGLKTKAANKYRNDYVKKYKLSLMFLLCSIYRKNKYFYSFNTFAFLSSGIVGHFIELCRKAFDVAGWGDNAMLLEAGRIGKEFQNIAAVDVSKTEKRQISRIEDYGPKISKLVENLGNIFREYQEDFKIKYPETNQFAINRHSLEDKDLRNAMSAAIKWSIIQIKPKMQSSSPGSRRQEIYTLNRIFSPSYQISYRTRGGFSIELTEEKLRQLFNSEKVEFKNFAPRERGKTGEGDLVPNEPTLFDNL